MQAPPGDVGRYKRRKTVWHRQAELREECNRVGKDRKKVFFVQLRHFWDISFTESLSQASGPLPVGTGSTLRKWMGKKQIRVMEGTLNNTYCIRPGRI